MKFTPVDVAEGGAIVPGMTYTVHLMGSVPDGGGVLPVWPLGIPPRTFATVPQASSAGQSEVTNMAEEGAQATFTVIDEQGRVIDSTDWSIGL